jgi:hypothetical protein
MAVRPKHFRVVTQIILVFVSTVPCWLYCLIKLEHTAIIYYKIVIDSEILYTNIQTNSGEYQSEPRWISRKEGEITLSEKGREIKVRNRGYR